MEHVILVDEMDNETGIMEKIDAHRKGLLHRAFSVFIFNSKGEMLLQRRASNKYHSAGLWTNACCSHPKPGEEILAAANRRLKEEMGFETKLLKVFDFTYQSIFDNGLTEHEFDHVFSGTYEGEIIPDKNEVQDFCFKTVAEIDESLQSHPHKYAVWFGIAFSKIKEIAKANAVEKS